MSEFESSPDSPRAVGGITRQSSPRVTALHVHRGVFTRQPDLLVGRWRLTSYDRRANIDRKDGAVVLVSAISPAQGEIKRITRSHGDRKIERLFGCRVDVSAQEWGSGGVFQNSYVGRRAGILPSCDTGDLERARSWGDPSQDAALTRRTGMKEERPWRNFETGYSGVVPGDLRVGIFRGVIKPPLVGPFRARRRCGVIQGVLDKGIVGI